MIDSEVNSGTYYYESGNMPQPVDEGGSGQPTYDANGNLQTYKGWTYTYDAQNRLTAADNNPTGTHVRYYYDPLNRRTASDVNGNVTINVWDGWNLIEERTSGNGLIYSYIQGAGVDEMVRRTGGSTTLWYYQDGRGNTSHLADDSGNLKERYTYDHAGTKKVYDPAGNPRPGGSIFANRFLFQGRDYSAELGLYDYRNRIYFPEWGRFLQPDPIGFGGDLGNIYRYCGGDPVNGRDPSGLGAPTIPWVSINGTPANTVVNSTPLPSGSAPFGPSAGIQFSGGTTPGSGHGTFFQGYVDPDTGNYVDTLPGPPTIVRAPPLGTPYYPPGIFPPGYSPSRFVNLPGRIPWDPLGDLMNTFRILITPAGGLVGMAQNGVTVTENVGLGPGMSQQLTLNLDGIYYRLGGGLGIGAGVSVTTAVIQQGSVTGPNITGSVSGGNGVAGAEVSGTLGLNSTSYSVDGGWGIGFGKTVTIGYTVFVPWPWRRDLEPRY